MDKVARGKAIIDRGESLGIIGDREFERMSAEVDLRVPRASVANIKDGVAADAIYRRAELALDRIAERMGSSDPDGPSEIEVRLRGLFGIEEVVFKAPVDNAAEMEAMIERLIRRAREGERPIGDDRV